MDKDRVKKLLNLPDDVYMKQESVISEIIDVTEDQLKSLLKPSDTAGNMILQGLEYIVELVTIKRYRRLGSGGMTAYTQSEQSKTFAQEDDFAEFMGAIDKYNDDSNTTRPTVWLL